MEVVHDFNNELSSLYEVKPPISKAKMMQITKSAIKGIKFYKHIVQSVEKFIQKCKPEYKVPGLYVIDSIVRQSRHQFGVEKEVFGPRFMKNILPTFQHLFRCADEDKPKIVRVLNLWQKNNVFPIEAIQPLMNMADPAPVGEYASLDNAPAPVNESPVRKAAPPPVVNETPPNSKHKPSSESWKGWPQGQEEAPTGDNHGYSEMSTKNLEKFTKANSGIMETIAPPPTTKSSELKLQDENTVKFNKKLLDFDYGDEDDEEEIKGDDGQTSLAYSISQNLLSHPELLRQLQQMQQSIQQNESLKSELNIQSQPVVQQKENRDPYSPAVPDNKIPSNMFMDTQPPLPQQPSIMYPYDNNAMGYPPLPPHMPMLPQDQKPPIDVSYPMLTQENLMIQSSQVDEDDRRIYSMPGEPPLPPQDLDERALMIPEDRIKKERSRSRSGSRGRGSVPFADLDERNLIQPGDTRVKKRRSRSRSDSRGQGSVPFADLDERNLIQPGDTRIKKRRSRSRSDSRGQGRSGRHRSRSRSPRRRKSRSRSRSRSRRNRSRSKDRDRERRKEREREKERERDRLKKGIPPVRKNAVSVCSTTLWLGHVPKTLSEADIASTYADFGTISSIDMIPPRGCAYVVMDRRQDANRALQKLKNLKLQGSSIKMAWAPGKGTKGKEYKDYWEVETGVTYIPFEKLSNDLAALDALGEGGFIDEESLPAHLREMRQQRDTAKNTASELHQAPLPAVGEKHGDKNGLVSQAPPLQATMLPPNLGSLPMVLPQMMQPQFGMPMPGLMPPQPMVVQHMPMPVGVPPPNPMMLVQPPSQNLLAGTPLPVGAVPQMPHLSMPHPSLSTVTLSMSHMASATSNVNSKSVKETLTAGDATPTDEDGTRVSPPPSTMQVMTTSASVTPVVSQSGIAQFNSAIGLHGAPRPPLLPGVPTSASNSLPFPPPHVGFGFPPPSLRHAAPPPPQNMPVVSLSSGFQWPKQSAPNFGAFSEADVRYSTSAGVLSGNIRPPSHQQGKMNVHINNQSSMPNRSAAQGSGESAPASKESANQSGESDKDHGRHTDHVNSEGFNARSNMPSKMFNRPLSPESYDMDIDHDDARDIFPGNRDNFPRDHRGVPHFHGHPPDFPPPPHGGMRERWMPGNVPGPRFQRGGMHGGLQFPPRGPRPVFPRMDMEYFPPQGPPPGPRMHGPTPHGFPPRRGGGNFPPPPVRERFPSRDFYNEPPHFDEGERNRGHTGREDWNQPRREWEEPNRRSEEGKRPLIPEREKLEQKDQPKPEESPTKTNADESLPAKAVPPESSTPSEVKPPSEVKLGESVPVTRAKPKTKQKNTSQDLFHDMFRLQNYGQRGRRGPMKSFGAPRPVKKAKPVVTKEDDTKEEKPVSTSEKKEEVETKTEPAELNSSDVQSNVTNSAEHAPIISETETVQEATNNKRERDRKRSSRWGRTLSEEREFQQQKINEASVNGGIETPDSHTETVPIVSNVDSIKEVECNLPVPTKCSNDVTSTVLEVDNVVKVSTDEIQPPPPVSQEPVCVTTNSESVEIVENAVTTGPVDSTEPVAL